MESEIPVKAANPAMLLKPIISGRVNPEFDSAFATSVGFFVIDSDLDDQEGIYCLLSFI
jgi:hypothetical protein